ncbi:hypothetical protein NA56DRAFT_434985 [Hyaloscypha hepaticicola]|uniref:Uncharacterized protein n=1 Tax=Hyaloscypha hepaticicola TaxID=2082293 RepID=A0A2J6QGL8_9HELO|nr:hypothetical protein NA56DRAFT_434985 [Hyaloscypha hepaticicola]
MIQESRLASLIIFIIFIPHIYLVEACVMLQSTDLSSESTPKNSNLAFPDRSLENVYQGLLRRSWPKVRGLQSMCALGTALKQTLSHGQAYLTFLGTIPYRTEAAFVNKPIHRPIEFLS